MNAEPRWLLIADLLRLHDYVLERTGGAAGVRDLGLLESALARPLNKWAYEAVDDINELAAAYGMGVAKNHPFIDGNKRAALLAAGLFLELNGRALIARHADVTRTFLSVAAGEMDEVALADWIRANSTAI